MLSPAEAYAANLIGVVASAGFALLGGFLIDRFPLRGLAITVMAGIAVTAVPGFLIITTFRTPGAAVLGQLLCSVFVGPAYSVGAVLAMTLFSTGIRFTAFAVPASIALALFGSTAPLVSTWLSAVTHNPLAPGFYLLVVAAVATVVAALVMRRRDADPVP
jgi:MHS family proline/betaine transporter-like MFS transporter